ncbi:bifunctional proline dehydrogenase/L-glutamate gamma-semialdehyde dehydrogenase [Hyphomicrobium methylovorum]|uniref:bifunctional proline dehydrogenase/L-glutamate gamma-semialdehyde dehydrogenase PutA n=1 Tax=Hyphomicrobium methylovorum TaxID=84 RepID=UPI0015E77EE7|nr:bifunctional proline dehydrogenase/L-glutamate gamma-semialdehyde dehydrogenase PutA [Hyphomicrobium methylovorum]MBA2127134.1 bifunctional proline dehydrogenase/L-glutamate gamma-semialdehyde dehydrogenase [Hyphomicrobium methylovorum]
MVAALRREDMDRGLPPRDELASQYLAPEHRLVGALIERAFFAEDERQRIADIARRLVLTARADKGNHAGVDAFMHEYGLATDEGVMLMCLAESLLRVPDSETANALIADKISSGAWDKHLGNSDSMFVNASTWGLLLTGRIMKLKEAKGANPVQAMKRLLVRSGEPTIRVAVRQAVKLLGEQFVLGTTIQSALARARSSAEGYRYSYDMLGEAARSEHDAERYFQRYMEAIDAIGADAGPFTATNADAIFERPSISVKLSALHPRFEPGKERRLRSELMPQLLTLVRAARAKGLGLTIDAEEQDRLDLTAALFGEAFVNPHLDGWHGLGIAVQAYGKRAIPMIRWLRRLAEQTGKRIPVRLVKGAYWDSEIKLAQERGLEDYPVFSRKLHTDVSYLAAMRLLISDPTAFYPQFATHNAHTIAAASVAGGSVEFEYQRLHGMGEALFAQIAGSDQFDRPCRIYAPVGGHEDLLGYLVRRLLENGANTSFVNRLGDDETSVADIIADPVEIADREYTQGDRPILIARPRDIFLPERKNSAGLALTEASVRRALLDDAAKTLKTPFAAGPIVSGKATTGGEVAGLVVSPHDHRERIGTVRLATPQNLEDAVAAATGAAFSWERTPATERARILEAAADLFERDRAKLIAALIREAGKTLDAAHGEIRETVDYLRYYATQARKLFAEPITLRGPTGEENTLALRGRGPFACISPWNFPVAIFTGQIAAALAAGNTVIAKPAEQAPIAGFLAVSLLHEAGVPAGALHFVTGGGKLGDALVRDPRIRGVAFTGSNETAWAIQRALAERRGVICPFIAETGGINAMIADSTALPEQVVRDAVRSAFDSAGQRCSAARVLFVQDDNAPRIRSMLAGAIEALDVGDPLDYATDIGPVIDEAAQDMLESHKVRMQREAREIIDVAMPESCRAGTYVTPALYEIDRFAKLDTEVFGPILHLVRYERGHLDRVIEALNATGYGLTLGLHSRIESVADYVAEHARVGNLYVNRNQIGAVVGVQPFGGEGLSGTGPKAGGPNYLMRFATERVVSTDVTATGGNYTLLSGKT